MFTIIFYLSNNLKCFNYNNGTVFEDLIEMFLNIQSMLGYNKILLLILKITPINFKKSIINKIIKSY